MTLVEFAMVGPILIVAMLGFMEFAYDFFVQQTVDYATSEAAREVQTGAVQSNSAVTNSASFGTVVMCPLLASLLSCSNLLVEVTAVSSFAGTQPFSPPEKAGTNNVDPTQFSYCSASGSQLILVRAVYFAPVWVSFLLPETMNFNGALALPLVSTAAFATEPFPQADTNYPGTPPSACT